MSASVTGTASSGSREVELSIRGMTCAACAARVERKLSATGDVAVSVNFATAKAAVSAPASVPVERLIEAVEQAGYGADLADADAAEVAAGAGWAGPDAARAAYPRRRLIVALVFFVPLSDLSVLLSLFPEFRFDGWQWVLVVLAAPIAGFLNPLIAGAAMAASSAFVMASSVRLRRFGEPGSAVSCSGPAPGPLAEPEVEAASCPG
jgi:P-type Cu+ transporter